MNRRADGSSRLDVICVFVGTVLFHLAIFCPFWLLVEKEADMANRNSSLKLNSSSSLNASSSCPNSTSGGQKCGQRQSLVFFGFWHKCSTSPFVCVKQADIFVPQQYLSVYGFLMLVSLSSFHPCAKRLGVTVRNVRLTWDKAFPLGFFASLGGLTLTSLFYYEAIIFEASGRVEGVHFFLCFYLALGCHLVILASSFSIARDRHRWGSFCASAASRAADDGLPPRRNVNFQMVVQFPEEADGIVQVPRLDGIGLEQVAKGRK